jgi:hypothetical protein
MSALHELHSHGVRATLDAGGVVRLYGLTALPPDRARRVVDFAKAHKARLQEELAAASKGGTRNQAVPEDPAEALALLVALLDRHPGLYLSFGYPQDRGPAFALQPPEHPAFSEGFRLFLKAVAAIVPRAGELRREYGGPRA